MTEKYTKGTDEAGAPAILNEAGDVIATERWNIWYLEDREETVIGIVHPATKWDAQRVGEDHARLMGVIAPDPEYRLSAEEGSPVIKNEEGEAIAIMRGDWKFYADGLLVGRAPISGDPDPAAVGALYAALVRFRGEVAE